MPIKTATADIRVRSLCISHGQNRDGERRNPDTEKSPAGRKVVRIQTVVFSA
jgi:hypothetical protein